MSALPRCSSGRHQKETRHQPVLFWVGLCSPASAIRNGVFFDVEADFGFGRRRWGRRIMKNVECGM
jgi:hypothetical protein